MIKKTWASDWLMLLRNPRKKNYYAGVLTESKKSVKSYLIRFKIMSAMAVISATVISPSPLASAAVVSIS